MSGKKGRRILTCQFCGKTEERNCPPDQEYCSRQCSAAARSGQEPQVGTITASQIQGNFVSFASLQEKFDEQDAADARERFEEARHKYLRFIGWDGKAKVPTIKKAQETRITAIGDVHIPCQDADALAEIYRRTKDDTDILIDCGDSSDNFNWSRYEKYKRPFTAMEEIVALQAYYVSLAETYPRVKLMGGNHDARFIKFLVRIGAAPELIEYLEFLAPGITNPMQRLVYGLKNVEVVEPTVVDHAEFPFIHQINDTIFSHAEKFSKVPNKAVGDVIHWLKSFAEPKGVVKPFRLVIQAHTHQAGKTFNNYGVVGIENGCVTLLPDYAGGSKLMGSQRPPVVGYSRIYQTNGVTDLDRSNFHIVKW